MLSNFKLHAGKCISKGLQVTAIAKLVVTWKALNTLTIAKIMRGANSIKH